MIHDILDKFNIAWFVLKVNYSENGKYSMKFKQLSVSKFQIIISTAKTNGKVNPI